MSPVSLQPHPLKASACAGAAQKEWRYQQ